MEGGSYYTGFKSAADWFNQEFQILDRNCPVPGSKLYRALKHESIIPESQTAAGKIESCASLFCNTERGTALFQSIECRAQLNDGRPLAIVRLNLCPGHLPVLINN